MFKIYSSMASKLMFKSMHRLKIIYLTLTIVLLFYASRSTNAFVLAALTSTTSRHFKIDLAEYYSIVPSDFYDRINEYESIYMYNLIFGAVDLGNEPCNIIFQNCLLNSENNDHVNMNVNLIHGSRHGGEPSTSLTTLVSTQCFPLKKAKFCLHKFNFAESDCAFPRIHDKTKVFHLHLLRNLEACLDRFPVSGAKSANLSSFSKQVNNEAVISERPLIFNSIFLLIPLVLRFLNS